MEPGRKKKVLQKGGYRLYDFDYLERYGKGRNLLKRQNNPIGLKRTDRWLLTVCAISCATISVTMYLLELDDTSGSYSNAVSRYITRPQFSIAPPLKSGTATWSGMRKECLWWLGK